ncbi:hypothetical protein DXG01_001100 [Tephrocybe rancida]|nr:hypothetical protein DXG01_001100 [Tephrocybe rancida]
MVTIDNPAFDLALALKQANEDSERHTDDAALMSPQPDSAAVEFWHTKSAGSNFRLSRSSGFVQCGGRDPADVENAAASAGQTKEASAKSKVVPRSGASAPAMPSSLKRNSDGPPSPEEEAPATKKGKNERVHRKRRERLEAKAEDQGHHPRRDKVVNAHVKGAPSIVTSMTPDDFPVAGGGFTALPGRPDEAGWFFKSLQEARDAGYRLIKWDGKTCMPFVSKDGRVFAVCVGQPSDPTYAEACQRAYELMAEEGRCADFTDPEIHHKRGDFPAINVGVTMGIGATYPTNLAAGNHSGMLRRFLSNKDIVRIANFTDAAFNLWAPDVHKQYRDNLFPLFKKLPYLHRIFARSIYPAAAFNLGPSVFTVAHRDGRNVPGGWCGIQALGTFDATKGGHIVFPSLKLVVEFPPGALILIPSATLTHANIPVQDGDCRASFTQYCSGGLFRYTECGYRTEAQLQRDDPKEYEKFQLLKETCWQKDYERYSLLADLVIPVDSAVEGGGTSS